MPAYTLVVHLHAKADCVERLARKLQEASQVYRNDRECLGWFVMQDHKDPRSFTIVERYAHENSQKFHLENPYWKTFDPYVVPLLDREMDLRRHHELETEDGQVRVEPEDGELWGAVERYQRG